MTERFCMNKGLYSFEDTVTGKTYSEYNLDEIVRLLNEFHKENKELKVTIGEMEDYLARMEEENNELKSLCKVLIKHIEKKSIAFVIDEEVRRLLE